MRHGPDTLATFLLTCTGGFMLAVVLITCQDAGEQRSRMQAAIADAHATARKPKPALETFIPPATEKQATGLAGCATPTACPLTTEVSPTLSQPTVPTKGLVQTFELPHRFTNHLRAVSPPVATVR